MNVTQLPFNKFLGLKESSNSDYYLELEYSQKYFNHLETMHASAQFALAEATSGLYLFKMFKEYADDIIPVVRRVEVKYSKPAQSKLYSTASITDIEKISEQLKIKNRLFINVNVDIYDENKNKTLQSTFEWYIQKK